MKKKYLILFLVGLLLVSCDGKKKRPAFYDNGANTEVDSVTYDNEVSSDYEQMADAEIVSIPFTEKGG